MSLQLIVVRHGETDWTRDGRYAGAHDVGLNPLGLRQCEATADTLAATKPSAVYASPLERARTSAEIIAKPHRLSVTIEPGFREMSFGEWEGCLRADIAASFPDLYGVWWSTPQLARLPGGETLPEVAARVGTALDALRARLWSLEASPAGITELEFEGDWATVHRMNTVVHLDGVAG